MKKSETAKLVAMILGTWPAHAARLGESAIPGMVDSYHRVLANLPSEDAAAALLRLSAISKFIPSPAELLEAAYETKVGARREGAAGWGDALKAIQRYGYTRTPGVDFDFEDPIVAECVRDLGWLDLCRSENAIADRARFVDLYDQKATSRKTATITGLLPGGAGSAPKQLGGTKPISAALAELEKRYLGTGEKS